MKKLLITAMIILINGSIFLSCKKSSSSPSTSGGATGYWFGSFMATNGLGGNEGQVFKSDGTTVEYDFYGTSSTDTATCPYKAYGTYTVSGNTVNFTVTFQSLNETFNEILAINTSVTPNTMKGTFTSPTAPGGSCSLTKQ
jgi:hypothetical protein